MKRILHIGRPLGVISLLLSLSFTSIANAESIEEIHERMGYTEDYVNEIGWRNQVTDFAYTPKEQYSSLSAGQEMYHQYHTDEFDDADCYAEIKNGEPFRERFEAMAGVPSKEKLFVTWGADPVKTDYQSYITRTNPEENYLSFSIPGMETIWCDAK